MRTPFSTKFNPSPGETTRSSIQILNPAKYSGFLGDSKEGKRKRLDTREDNHCLCFKQIRHPLSTLTHISRYIFCLALE